MEHQILVNICAIFGFTTAIIIICRLLKIRYIIGYLIAGILLSPNTSDILSNSSEVAVYAELGVILLLFTVGLEFSFSNLKQIRNYVLIGGGVQVGLTILISAVLVGGIMKLDRDESIFIGFMYALSSTAIVIKVLQDSGIIHSAKGKFILAVLLFQDIMIVPLMLLTPILAGNAGGVFMPLAILLGKLVLMGGISYFLAEYAIPYLLQNVMRVRSQEVFVIAIVFIVSGIALFTEAMGLSLALGAFLAGLILSETEYRERAMESMLPFKYVFLSFFFISVGMLLDYRIFILDWHWILFWFVFTIVVKTAVATFAALLLKVKFERSIAIGFSLAQIGEFSFILAQSGLKYDLMSGEHYQIFLAVAISMMAMTPLMVDRADDVAKWVVTKLGSNR